MKNVLTTLFLLFLISCSVPNNQEDLEYLINSLEDNYPNQIEISTIFSDIDYNLLNRHGANDFKGYISYMLKKFNEGHLNVLSGNEVAHYLNLYSQLSKEYPRLKPWVSILQDSNPMELSPSTEIVTTSPHQKLESMTTFKLFGSTGYITIPSFDHSLIEEDKEKFIQFYRENPLLESVIIDIRNNGGGSSSYWQDLIVSKIIKTEYNVEELALYKDGDITEKFYNVSKFPTIDNYKGIIPISEEYKKKYKYYKKSKTTIEPKEKLLPNLTRIFLITNNVNYSSSEKLAYFSKYTGFATIVGTQTNGGGVGSDPILIKLPNSGLIIRMPAENGLNLDGTSNNLSGTHPDIEVKNIDKLTDIEIYQIIESNSF